MAVKTLRLADLKGLSPAELTARAEEFASDQGAPLNGEASLLHNRIAAFETRYEMSSETMRKHLADRTLKETADICAWSMLLNLRDKLGLSPR
jgi:hypothetical protein